MFNVEMDIIMKSLYIQPIVEVTSIQVAHIICVSQNAPLTNGGGTEIVDPSQGI